MIRGAVVPRIPWIRTRRVSQERTKPITTIRRKDLIPERVAALSSYYLAMATRDRISPEEAHEALDALFRSYLPNSIIRAELNGLDEATIEIRVTPSLRPDDGVRTVEPRAIPLIATLTLFATRLGDAIHLANTTSKVRLEKGAERLHYVYLFRDPHLTLARILADAGAAKRAEFIGGHRDLRRTNLRLEDDSTRTDTAAREAAIAEAMRLHRIAGAEAAKYMPAASYEAMLRFAFRFFDEAEPAVRIRQAA